jgi:hypothetical protein
MPREAFLEVLAKSFVAGEQAVERIVAHSSRILGKRWRWLRPLAQRYVDAFPGQTRPRHREVMRFLLRDRGFGRACSKYYSELSAKQLLFEPQPMQPAAAARTWDVPAIETVGELAYWLEIDPGQLDWFADLAGLTHQSNRPQLDHYHYRLMTKRYGNIRLIEVPKARLKQLQRQILSGILDKIPPHPAAHGFIKGRSIQTFVAPHVGQRVVLRMDLCDFFPSIRARRIQALFRTIGYPEAVADLLGGISTNVAPRGVWREPPFDVERVRWCEARALYSRPHLPQGAPASPALANLCAYRVDCRLAGLAHSAGAAYTRYADDLAFSGGAEFDRRVERFSAHVAAILHEEGFTVHHRKTRIMHQGVRQHLAGVVANQRINVMRTDFDLLKATLTNCVRLGAESQNRDAHPRFRLHLDGRVAFVEMINPARGQRLRTIFERIQWGGAMPGPD